MTDQAQRQPPLPREAVPRSLEQVQQCLKVPSHPEPSAVAQATRALLYELVLVPGGAAGGTARCADYATGSLRATSSNQAAAVTTSILQCQFILGTCPSVTDVDASAVEQLQPTVKCGAGLTQGRLRCDAVDGTLHQGRRLRIRRCRRGAQAVRPKAPAASHHFFVLPCMTSVPSGSNRARQGHRPGGVRSGI